MTERLVKFSAAELYAIHIGLLNTDFETPNLVKARHYLGAEVAEELDERCLVGNLLLHDKKNK